MEKRIRILAVCLLVFAACGGEEGMTSDNWIVSGKGEGPKPNSNGTCGPMTTSQGSGDGLGTRDLAASMKAPMLIDHLEVPFHHCATWDYPNPTCYNSGWAGDSIAGKDDVDYRIVPFFDSVTDGPHPWVHIGVSGTELGHADPEFAAEVCIHYVWDSGWRFETGCSGGIAKKVAGVEACCVSAAAGENKLLSLPSVDEFRIDHGELHIRVFPAQNSVGCGTYTLIWGSRVDSTVYKNLPATPVGLEFEQDGYHSN